jgi:hypothetical protein
MRLTFRRLGVRAGTYLQYTTKLRMNHAPAFAKPPVRCWHLCWSLSRAQSKATTNELSFSTANRKLNFLHVYSFRFGRFLTTLSDYTFFSSHSSWPTVLSTAGAKPQVACRHFLLSNFSNYKHFKIFRGQFIFP